jgi:hypothetical protein
LIGRFPAGLIGRFPAGLTHEILNAAIPAPLALL